MSIMYQETSIEADENSTIRKRVEEDGAAEEVSSGGDGEYQQE